MTRSQAFLSALPEPQRSTLEALRRQVLDAMPGIVEHFGYGMPGFKFKGHPVLYIGAAKDHCALYGSVPPGFGRELKRFKTTKGAIRYAPDKPLPAALVKAIVLAKCAAIEAKWGGAVERSKR